MIYLPFDFIQRNSILLYIRSYCIYKLPSSFGDQLYTYYDLDLYIFKPFFSLSFLGLSVFFFHILGVPSEGTRKWKRTSEISI